MAYFKNNMPFLNRGDKVWKTIPDKNGMLEVDLRQSANNDAPFRRKALKTDSSNIKQVLDITHSNVGKYFNGMAYNLFYYRMILPKTTYDFGIITGDKVEKFTVFNGYPNEVVLNSISLRNLSGVEIRSESGTLPIRIPPFRSVDLRILLSSQGSSKLDGSFVMRFSNGDTLSVNIRGSRLILWNIRPNWTNTIKEQFEYKTDVLTSYNKKEQRRGFMTQPRRRYSYVANPNANVLMNLRNIIHGWHDKPFMLPIWWQPAKLERVTRQGSKQIILTDNEQYDFVKGGSLVLWIDEFTNEVCEIKEINGNRIEFDAPVSRDYYPLNTTVYPCVQTRLNDEFELTNLTSTAGELHIEMNAVMQAMRIKMPDDLQADATFKGIEVLERKPNWADDVSETYNGAFGVLDYGYGVRQYYSRNVPSLVVRKMEFLAANISEIRWWKAFIQRQKGALKSFIVPTHTFDAILVDDVAVNATQLVFRDDYLSTVVKESAERKYLRVKTAEKVYYFTIKSLRNSADTVVVTLNETVPELIRAKDVQHIQFMQRMRFASDNVEIEYVTRKVAKLSLSLQQVREYT